MRNPFKIYGIHGHMHGAFGSGWYGAFAERVARFMGTPVFLTTQTTILIIWVLLNGVILPHNGAWDIYPFILLNLCLSFQAAYAAPLILVAANRQAERDRAREKADVLHREELHLQLVKLIEQNTLITKQMASLTEELHKHIMETT